MKLRSVWEKGLVFCCVVFSVDSVILSDSFLFIVCLFLFIGIWNCLESDRLVYRRSCCCKKDF